MSEDPLPRLKKFSISLGKFGRNKKRNILIITILASAASLFFSVLFRTSALAEKNVSSGVVSLAVVDPLGRIGQSSLEKIDGRKKDDRLCETGSMMPPADDSEPSQTELDYQKILVGHPMEDMAVAISKKDSAVAAFLIGIAKKESDWGTHSPKKDGHECYNFWGYKGGYNVTEGGYSCFDSPEQAVEVVGGRIEELIAKNINTPARMVVWKCGSSCAGHDPVAVKKWISDVSAYYYQSES
jgi:hypothetical protein